MLETNTYSQLESTEGDPLTFILIPGAYHAPESYWLLTAELRDRGHSVVCPEIPSNVPGTTFVDDAWAVEEQSAGLENAYVVTHSRAAESLPWLLDIKQNRDRFIGATLLSSCGPRYLGGAHKARYLKDFLKGIETQGDDLVVYNSQAAIRNFYNRVKDEGVLTRAVSLLRPQRKIDLYDMPPPLPKDFKTQALTGRYDRVHHLNVVWRNIMSWTNSRPTMIDSDHTPQLSCPKELASMLIRHALACQE